MITDSLRPGDTATWNSVAGTCSGQVLTVDDRGAMVRTARGKFVILSTTRSMAASREERSRRIKQLLQPKQLKQSQQ